MEIKSHKKAKEKKVRIMTTRWIFYKWRWRRLDFTTQEALISKTDVQLVLTRKISPLTYYFIP